MKFPFALVPRKAMGIFNQQGLILEAEEVSRESLISYLHSSMNYLILHLAHPAPGPGLLLLHIQRNAPLPREWRAVVIHESDICEVSKLFSLLAGFH